MKRLTDVRHFGAIAAEDDDLQRYFVRTPVFADVLSGDRQVVIGRKGAGKTALYLATLSKAGETGAYAVGLSFKDYPWALHYQYASQSVDQYERLVASWRFLIYLEIFKIIITDKERKKRYTKSNQKDAIGQVEAFVADNWGATAFDFKKTFPAGGLTINGGSIAPQVAGFAAGGINIQRQGARLGETLERLNDWLWNCLECLGPEAPKVYVLFDELDLGFDPENDDYVDRTVGLLLAVRLAARAFKNGGMPFYPVAFLRSDIFDALHFGDKNKLAETNAAFLVWNTDIEYSGCSLKELIDARIREQLDTGDNGDPWGCAFDEQQMRGTQHKFTHMVFRSYNRPRDIIKFCNCALERAKARLGSTAKSSDRIGNIDVVGARRAYSEYLLAELDDEISQAHRDWQKNLEILRKLGLGKFSRDEFSKQYSVLKSSLDLVSKEEEILHLFYRYSIVGFEKVKRSGSGFYYHFRYMGESIRLDTAARTFLVHRGLKEGLELVEASRERDQDDLDNDAIDG